MYLQVFEAMPVFAGDMVPKKKPDPAIYKLAAEKLEVDPARHVDVCTASGKLQRRSVLVCHVLVGGTSL